MIRPPGKPYKIAQQVLKGKGVKLPKREVNTNTPKNPPTLAR